MRLFYVRHQAAGIIYEHPFQKAPSQAEIDALLAQCAARQGDRHPKTGEPYWAKVVTVENGNVETLGDAHGNSAADVDLRAAGGCPIREAGFERWPDAGETETLTATAIVDVEIAGAGTVRNPG